MRDVDCSSYLRAASVLTHRPEAETAVNEHIEDRRGGASGLHLVQRRRALLGVRVCCLVVVSPEQKRKGLVPTVGSCVTDDSLLPR